MPDKRPRSRSRFTIEPSSPRSQRASRIRSNTGTPEVWVAVSIIVAAGMATFLALLLTSRPFDPMRASVRPEQVVPGGPNLSTSPRSSPTVTPPSSPTPARQESPGGEISNETPDDATIQSRVESALASDSILSKLDVSTLVENGKVTILGSVGSAELKQRVERAIRAVKGVAAVDNQLVVIETTPAPAPNAN